MHSRIESKARNRSIFTQAQWCDIIKEAKTEEPKYVVHEMQQNEIFAFSNLAQKNFWNKIKISTLSELKVHPDKKIEFIYDYDNEVNVKFINFNENQELDICYTNRLQLDKSKKEDLSKLMEKGLIPSDSHYFYNELFN